MTAARGTLPGPNLLRSVGAVAAGFLTVMVLSVATDGVMHALGVFPPWGAPMSSGRFVLALAYRVAFTVLGGYLTARLAPRRPLRHAGALCVLGLLGGVGGMVAWKTGGPAMGPVWYPALILLTAVPSILAGAQLAQASARRRTP